MAEPLNGIERLALLHGMLHIGECEPDDDEPEELNEGD
jgi:hypothetical protein